MKKFTVLSLVSAAALIVAPVVFAQGVVDGNTNPYHVAGEKLDSGLGDLVAVRRAEASPKAVPTAHSAIPAIDYHVAGEKLDSGLGNMTAYGAPAKNTVARSF
jgi:hypothetical protein